MFRSYHKRKRSRTFQRRTAQRLPMQQSLKKWTMTILRGKKMMIFLPMPMILLVKKNLSLPPL